MVHLFVSFPSKQDISRVDDVYCCRILRRYRWKDGITKPDVKHMWVPHSFRRNSVVNTFRIKHKRTDAEILGPSCIITAVDFGGGVAEWVVQNLINNPTNHLGSAKRAKRW